MNLLPPIVSAGATSVVTDALGRDWDPRKHPRDRKGKFIHTNRLIRAFVTPDGSSPWATGKVSEINPDGSIRMEVQKVSDPANNAYVGKLVDVKPDTIENINEKAKLTMFGKPQMPSAPNTGNYEFDAPQVQKFLSDSGDRNPQARAVELTKKWNDLKAGKTSMITSRDKLDMALYAKSQSGGADGEDRKHSDSEFMGLLENLGVDSNTIDDTPDGMSGLQYLMDQINETHSPGDSNKDSEDWFSYVPMSSPDVLKEMKLKDSDVRIRWYNDGTQTIVWPDGTEEQHDKKKKGSLFLAAQETHEAEGVSPPEAAPAADNSAPELDPDRIRSVADKVRNSSSEYGEDTGDALDSIAYGVEDGRLSQEEYRKQMNRIASDLYDENDETDDAHLVDLADEIEELATHNVGSSEPIADLGDVDTGDDFEDTPEPDAPVTKPVTPTPAPAVDPIQREIDQVVAQMPGLAPLMKNDPRYDSFVEYIIDSFETNDIIRENGGTDGLGPRVTKQINDIDGIMNDRRLENSEVVYRGVSRQDDYEDQFQELLDSLKEGAVVRDEGFVSTSRDEEVALGFARGGIDTDPSNEIKAVLFEIDVPGGSAAIDTADFMNGRTDATEQEILLPHGSDIRVDMVEKQGDTLRVYASLVNTARTDKPAPDPEPVNLAPDPSPELPATESRPGQRFGYGISGGNPTTGDVIAETSSTSGPPFDVAADSIARVTNDTLPGGKLEIEHADGRTEVINPYDRQKRFVKLTNDDVSAEDFGFDPPIYSRGETNIEGKVPSLVERSSVNQYTTADYYNINRRLREGNLKDYPALRQISNNIDGLMDRSKLSRDRKLYRGLTGDNESMSGLIDSMQPGAVVQDMGFVSTSTRPEIAQEFIDNNLSASPDRRHVMFEIDAPAGTNAVDVHGIEPNGSRLSENEILLPHGSRFEVMEVTQDGDTTRVRVRITDEEVRPAPRRETPGSNGVDAKSDSGDTASGGFAVGSRVRGADGSEGTIVRFEANGTGVVVLGDDGKKRGRKMSRLTVIGGGTAESDGPTTDIPKVSDSDYQKALNYSSGIENKRSLDRDSEQYKMFPVDFAGVVEDSEFNAYDNAVELGYATKERPDPNWGWKFTAVPPEAEYDLDRWVAREKARGIEGALDSYGYDRNGNLYDFNQRQLDERLAEQNAPDESAPDVIDSGFEDPTGDAPSTPETPYYGTNVDSKGQPLEVGTRVRGADGVEGEIVRFEANGTGVVVLGDDGKKRGRKMSKLEAIGGGDSVGKQMAPPTAQAPVPQVGQDTSSTPSAPGQTIDARGRISNDPNADMTPDTIDHALSVINPQFSTGDNQWIFNCTNASVAYELRRRGFKVKAAPRPHGRMMEDVIRAWQTTRDVVYMSRPGGFDQSLIDDNFSKYPDNSRGFLFVSLRAGGMHMMSWEKIDGKVQFLDAQTNGRPSAELVSERVNPVAYSIRADNLPLPDNFNGWVLPE